MKSDGNSRVAEIAIPQGALGWVLVGRCRGQQELLAGAAAQLHDASLATLTLELPWRAAAAEAAVRLAAARLRGELADGLPVAYLAAGAGAGLGWSASLAGDLDGVIAYRGWPGRAWHDLPRVTVPSLLLLDREGPGVAWQRLVAQALSWRLGASTGIDLIGDRPELDFSAVARWYWDRMLAPQPAPLPRRSHRRVATLGVAAALALPIAGALALPDFSAGATLPGSQIGGDSAISSPRTPVSTPPAAEGKTLSAGDIFGDDAVQPHATGREDLIDGDGVEYFVNTNITFSTTSSASAAMSEASFTHSVAASTLNGGTTQSRLNDSYDGYQSLCVSTDNTVGNCRTNNANFTEYNKNGVPPEASCTGTVSGVPREYTFPVQTVGQFQVYRELFVPDNDSFARWLDVVTNTGSTPATTTLDVANNLGSDNNTVITADSSGNTTPTTADTWVTSFQNWSGTTTSDPRLGHVLAGAGASTGLAGIFFQNGNDKPWWSYSLTLQPGQTQIVMNYGVVAPTKAAAASKSAELATLSDPNQLNCMTPQEQAEVVNFALLPLANADSYTATHDASFSEPAPGVLANDTGGGTLTATLVSGPAHASSFTLNPDGSFNYTPAPGYAGADSFTYEAVSSDGESSTPQTVSLTVTGAAPTITSAASAAFTVGQPGSFTVTAPGAPYPSISESPALPAGLTLKDNGNGTATISGTPAAGTGGSYPLTVTATNGEGAAATQTLTLTVTAPPAAPSATNHTYSAKENKPLFEKAPGVLSGATGTAPLHAVLVSGSSHSGVVSLGADGSFTYAPKAGFTGTDRFTYAVTDANGTKSAPATVTVRVAKVAKPSTGGTRAEIESIMANYRQILKSYRQIVTATDKFIAEVDSPTATASARAMLVSGAKLAKRAEKSASSPSIKAADRAGLRAAATAREQISLARRDAAQARALAARALTTG
jgi:hypothetical protein